MNTDLIGAAILKVPPLNLRLQMWKMVCAFISQGKRSFSKNEQRSTIRQNGLNSLILKSMKFYVKCALPAGLWSRRFLCEVGFFWPTPDVRLDHFSHHIPKLGIPIEMVRCLPKLLEREISCCALRFPIFLFPLCWGVGNFGMSRVGYFGKVATLSTSIMNKLSMAKSRKCNLKQYVCATFTVYLTTTLSRAGVSNTRPAMRFWEFQIINICVAKCLTTTLSRAGVSNTRPAMRFWEFQIINICVAKCLVKRCREIMESKLSDTQCGFRPDRSITDHISLSSKILRNLGSMLKTSSHAWASEQGGFAPWIWNC